MTTLNTMTGRSPEYWAALLAFALAVGGTACSDAAPITGPTPRAGLLPPPLVVRGTVIEFLLVSPDERPLAGVPLRVFGGGTVVEVTSGADGSYEAHVPSTATFVRVAASGTLHFTPCPSFRSGGKARLEEPMDVHVVSGATLTNGYLPNSYPMDYRTWVGGQVRTSGELEPVPGATVTLRSPDALANPTASTVTDARGLYSLCGATSRDFVEARKEGFVPASVPPVLGWDFESTDLWLTRR